VGEQPATDDRAERVRGDRRASHDRQRALPFVLGEEHRQDRQAQREHERRGQPEQRPGSDELPGRGGVRAGERAEPEQGQRGQQQPLAAEAVAEQPGRKHHRAEDQQVGIDEPLQLGG